MKLSDFLSDVGRPIAYYPKLAKVVGGVKATVFLCQLFYWRDKSNNYGWVYKTADEWQDETGLTYDEQRGARRALVSAKVIEEKYQRLEHKMLYRVKADELNRLWEAKFPNLENPNSGDGETQDGEPGKPEFVNRNAETTTETTTEITTETLSVGKPSTDSRLEIHPEILAELTRQAESMGRRPPKRYASIQQAEAYEAAIKALNGQTAALVQQALKKGITDRGRLLSYLEGCVKRQGKPMGQYSGQSAQKTPVNHRKTGGWVNLPANAKAETK